MKLIQILFLLFGFFMLLFAYFNKKSKRLKLDLVLFIYVTGIFLILFTLFPSTSTVFANILGISRGVDVLIYLSLPLLFYLVFLLYVRLEELNKKLTKMVRIDAIKNAKKK